MAAARGPAHTTERRVEVTGADGTRSAHVSVSLHVGEADFVVSRSVADITWEGDEYIVYYRPKTNDILSLDRVTKP